ncbi:hypothetical protein PUN28_016264 [Cardiocondyla obscurior]|uniref:GH18 domain-containing protein n=2 Tax=Cardiocondyla obscurior TaxID=286306 RepID=A0AAW2EUM5_9HYME
MNDHGTDVISPKPHHSNGRSDRGFKVPGKQQSSVSTLLSLLKTTRMKTLFSVVLAVLCIQAVFGADSNEHNKVVCYWNSTAYERQGPAKFQLEDVKPALSLCTHLIYGYAHINSDFEIVPGSPSLDTGSGYSYYRLATQLKRTYPDLKIYLSVGGNSDPYDEEHKYLVLTETSEGRTKFINSVNRLLNDYDFDGIDLAWQFPPIRPKKQRSTLGSIWHGLKKKLGYGKFQDDKEQEHRDGFTILVRDLKSQLRPRHKALTITVLPHVNASIYYDARLLAPNIEAVHLFAFDQKTPERNAKEADFPAPVYASYGRVAEDNIDVQARYWLEHGTPGSRIVIGIPTYARTWKLTADSQISGVPPIVTDGPGAPGPNTNEPGLLSYSEMCAKLTEHAAGKLRQVNDPSKKYGSYAYQSYNGETGAEGIWAGYENPDTAGNKATFVKSKGLGGVAIVDLSLDDFRGVCTGDKYPIVRGAKYKL